MENLGILYDHLVYFTAIGNTLRPFVIIWYIYPPFWYFGPRKIWQPWLQLGAKVKIMGLQFCSW
jgi:hypothetical protein